jgi:hypothetical protein
VTRRPERFNQKTSVAARAIRTSKTRLDVAKITKRTGTEIKGPIKKFEGDDFVVGMLGITTTFHVEKTPYEEDGMWRMKVDGANLVRISGEDLVKAIKALDEQGKTGDAPSQ